MAEEIISPVPAEIQTAFEAKRNELAIKFPGVIGILLNVDDSGIENDFAMVFVKPIPRAVKMRTLDKIGNPSSPSIFVTGGALIDQFCIKEESDSRLFENSEIGDNLFATAATKLIDSVKFYSATVKKK